MLASSPRKPQSLDRQLFKLNNDKFEFVIKSDNKVKSNVVINLFSIQFSMKNSIPFLATFSQSLSILLNYIDIDIISNIAISDLSLYKVCNKNYHPN